MKQERRGTLRSKLAPALSPSLLERERLLQSLAALGTKRLAMVVAGPGYGKTTFVAQTLGRLNMDYAWLNLDAYDQDVGIFLQGIVAAIRERHPGFGQAVLHQLARFRAGGGYGVSKHQDGPVETLLWSLENEIPDALALVLDDFHFVQAEAEVLEVVEHLLPRLPRAVHLVLLARSLPQLRLSRLRAARAVIDIGPAELAFTREESAALCRMLIAEDVDPARLERLFSQTDGWAAALVLACAGAGRTATDGKAAEILAFAFPDDLLHQYLRENVFSGLPAPIREFMLRTSILPWLDPELCNLVAGGIDALGTLEFLSARCLLILSRQGKKDVFVYHHLLRTFLQEQLAKRFGDEEVLRLHRLLGELFEARDDLQNALRHHLLGGGHERLCTLLSRLVLSDLARCSLRVVARAVDVLPVAMLRRHPAVLHVRALIASLRGDTPGALRGFQEALGLLEVGAEPAARVRCLKDLGFHRYLAGDVAGAYDTLRVLWRETDLDCWFHGEVGGLLVFFASLLGRFDEALAWRDAALARIMDTGGAVATLARHWIGFCDSVRLQLTGDFDSAGVFLDRAMEAFVAAGAEFLLPIAHMQTALNLALSQRHQEGLEHAEQGLHIAAQLGMADHQHAWLFHAKASNYLAAGDVSAAMLFGYEALERFASLGNPWGQSAVKELFGQAMLRKGRFPEAVDLMREALDLVRETGLVIWQGQVQLGLAEALLGAKRLDEAAAVLDATALSETPSAFNRFRWLLCMAMLEARCSRRAKADECLAKAADLGKRYGCTAWLAAHPIGIAAMARANPEDAADAGLWDLLRRLPPEQDAVRVPVDATPTPPLQITCLDGFRITIGDRIIPHEAWRNAKARRIFQRLALTHRQGFTSMDALLELAWPEEDPRRTTGRFHVALHTVRRLLEPRLHRGQHSSYVVRQGDAYRLEVGECGGVDVLRFLQAVEQARRCEAASASQALERYVAAEALCAGELLPSQEHEEWLDDLRLRVQSAHCHALSRIMRFLEQAQEWAACIEYSEKHLILNEHSEPTYRTLMRCRAALGDMAGVVETHRRCERAIVDGLGYPLSAETMALLVRLTASPRP